MELQKLYLYRIPNVDEQRVGNDGHVVLVSTAAATIVGLLHLELADGAVDEDEGDHRGVRVGSKAEAVRLVRGLCACGRRCWAGCVGGLRALLSLWPCWVGRLTIGPCG